jgi:putative oxidoreductase
MEIAPWPNQGVDSAGKLQKPMFSKIFSPGNDSALTSLGLMTLRLWLGVTVLLNHGIGKLKAFDSMAPSFADPFKIGHTASFALVVFAEVVAATLVAVGLLTRFGALVLVVNMTVAFVYVHKASLSGAHSGELPFIYLAGFVTLLLSGPGRFALDQRFFGGKAGSSKKPKDH